MTGEDKRIARKAAAFDAWLDNIPTVRNPKGGDRTVVSRASQIIDEPEPESQPVPDKSET